MTNEEKAEELNCESLMINTSTGTGYWFCKENGSLRVDKEYCQSCLLNKKLDVEIEQAKASVMARIASRIFKN